MRTALGCFVWIVVFALVLLFERAQLQRLPALSDLPQRGLLDTALAALLAPGVTLTAGSLCGLFAAARRRSRGTPSPGGWRDGEVVRVGGVLEAEGAVLQAPFSGRPAVCLTYSAHTWQRGFEGTVPQDPHFRGLQHVPCRLHVDGARLALRGFPSPRHVVEQVVDGPQAEAGAARHLARTAWQASPDIASADLAAFGEPFRDARPGTGPDAGLHLMNRLASEALDLPRLAGQEAALLQRLRERPWRFKERVWAPGEAVTAVGTWHAQPPHLDVGYGVTSADHGLHPGGAERLARRESGTALGFALVLGVLTAAVHVVAWHRDGALLRAAAQALGLL